MCEAAASALAVISLCEPYLSAARGNHCLRPGNGSLMQKDEDDHHPGAFASPAERLTLQMAAQSALGERDALPSPPSLSTYRFKISDVALTNVV